MGPIMKEIFTYGSGDAYYLCGPFGVVGRNVKETVASGSNYEGKCCILVLGAREAARERLQI